MGAMLNFGPAKKFLYTCEYLRGIEINIKKRGGKPTTATVINFGAIGTVWTKCRLWANVKDNKTGRMMQVDLMELYRMYPRSLVQKALDEKAAAEQQPAIAETA